MGTVVTWSFKSVFQLVDLLDELFLFDGVDVVILMDLPPYFISFVQQLLIGLLHALYAVFFLE